MTKRETEREQRAKSRAIRKQQEQELLAPVDEQRYRLAEAAEEAKLRSNSTSPDLSASIRLVRTLLQRGLDAGTPARVQADLFKVFHNLCRTQCAILLQLSILTEDKSLADLAQVCVEVARDTLRREGGDVDTGVEYIESGLRQILNRANLAKVNEPQAIEMTSDQTYCMGETQPTYEAASTTLDQSAELQLCRFYIQRSLDEGNLPAVIVLLKQEMAMAMSQLQFGKQSGSLINRDAAREVTLSIIARVSEGLKLFAPDFEAAIDGLRERVMERFNQQPEQERIT